MRLEKELLNLIDFHNFQKFPCWIGLGQFLRKDHDPMVIILCPLIISTFTLKLCLFRENVLVLGIGGFRILGIVYTVSTLVLEVDFLQKGCAYYGKCVYYEWGQY